MAFSIEELKAICARIKIIRIPHENLTDFIAALVDHHACKGSCSCFISHLPMQEFEVKLAVLVSQVDRSHVVLKTLLISRGHLNILNIPIKVRIFI